MHPRVDLGGGANAATTVPAGIFKYETRLHATWAASSVSTIRVQSRETTLVDAAATESFLSCASSSRRS